MASLRLGAGRSQVQILSPRLSKRPAIAGLLSQISHWSCARRGTIGAQFLAGLTTSPSVGFRRRARSTGDRLRLEQALGNLVDNALRHGEGKVRIEAQASDSRVEIHVRDQGPGFPADFLGRAFHRFSRGDASHTGAGTGLGLAIVEAIAHAHQGTANAANGPHGGADVSITLPLRS
jgi:signal transduction histidine kinase